MSQKPPKKSMGPGEAGSDRDPQETGKAGNYEVGYGKPPKNTRFVRGQSGNPRGRPRKTKPKPLELSDAPSDFLLAAEAYREIPVHENGNSYTITAAQAVFRRLLADAIKGNRLSQQFVVKLIAAAEQLHQQNKIERYARLAKLKREGKRLIAQHERLGKEPPVLLPHPDDIVLDPETGEAHVDGPSNEEESQRLEFDIAFRNHLLLRAADAEETGGGPTIEVAGERACAYLVFAQLMDRFLPRRQRWQRREDVFLYMEYQAIGRRERQKQIRSEFAHLERARPRETPLPPEVERVLSRLCL